MDGERSKRPAKKSERAWALLERIDVRLRAIRITQWLRDLNGHDILWTVARYQHMRCGTAVAGIACYVNKKPLPCKGHSNEMPGRRYGRITRYTLFLYNRKP